MKSSSRFLLACLCVLVPVSVFATDDHLLLSEAAVTPTMGEFIEITNPTASSISLDEYYLSDDEEYALLPAAFNANPDPADEPNIAGSDFIVQFPPGFTIDPGGVVVVAFNGLDFQDTYPGIVPDFEIVDSDAAIPDMVDIGFLGGTAGLTNSGEHVVLFTWDASADLVTDVDVVNIGTPSGTNDVGNKTGLMVDGPDADADASTYAADAGTIPQQAADPTFGFSTKRIDTEASGSEATGGGNGITGDDETTEDITISWDGPIFTAPNPGVAGSVSCDPPTNLTCDSDCTSNDVILAWMNPVTYDSIEIYRDGIQVGGPLAGTDTSFVDPGVATGVYEYEVRGICGPVIGTTVCTVLHCPPPISSDLKITEVVDGTLISGRPRWVEITNCSSGVVDLTFYSIGNLNNGGGTLGGGQSTLLLGALSPGESYIYEYDIELESRFNEVYNTIDPPNQFAGGGFINGNDVIALFAGLAVNDGGGSFVGTVIDVYGVIGEDGVGAVWEYTDSYAQRNTAAPQSDTFIAGDWTFGGVDALEGTDPDPLVEDDDIALMQALTNPRVYDCGGGVMQDQFIRGDADGSGDINTLVDALFILAFGFQGGPAPICPEAADVDGTGDFNALVDVLYLLAFGFQGGAVPPAPYPACGDDPDLPNSLGCAPNGC